MSWVACVHLILTITRLDATCRACLICRPRLDETSSLLELINLITIVVGYIVVVTRVIVAVIIVVIVIGCIWMILVVVVIVDDVIVGIISIVDIIVNIYVLNICLIRIACGPSQDVHPTCRASLLTLKP